MIRTLQMSSETPGTSSQCPWYNNAKLSSVAIRNLIHTNTSEENKHQHECHAMSTCVVQPNSHIHNHMHVAWGKNHCVCHNKHEEFMQICTFLILCYWKYPQSTTGSEPVADHSCVCVCVSFTLWFTLPYRTTVSFIRQTEGWGFATAWLRQRSKTLKRLKDHFLLGRNRTRFVLLFWIFFSERWQSTLFQIFFKKKKILQSGKATRCSGSVAC